MKLSLFKIGLILTVLGVILSAYTFSENHKISQSLTLDTTQTKTLDVDLIGEDIGFYKISLPSLGDSVFVQIQNSKESVITDKKIETKSAVNYFDFRDSDIYTIKVTNLSENSLIVDIEFGQTNVSEMKYSGIVVLVGIMLMIFSSYNYLKNHKIAQPDENSS